MLIPQAAVTYTVNYSANGQSASVKAKEGDSFTLSVIAKDCYRFYGYYIGDDQMTDSMGKKLDSYTLSSDITVEARYTRVKTDEGIFAFYAHQGGTDRKIFKYNVVGAEHRFDEVRDITINTNTSDTKNYQQSDVNSKGEEIKTRRLFFDFMRTETYDGYAYYTTGYLYKTKTFLKNETTAVAASNNAIITDLMVRDRVLYVFGFKKTNTTANAYTNYVWSLDSSNSFT